MKHRVKKKKKPGAVLRLSRTEYHSCKTTLWSTCLGQQGASSESNIQAPCCEENIILFSFLFFMVCYTFLDFSSFVMAFITCFTSPSGSDFLRTRSAQMRCKYLLLSKNNNRKKRKTVEEKKNRKKKETPRTRYTQFSASSSAMRSQMCLSPCTIRSKITLETAWEKH